MFYSLFVILSNKYEILEQSFVNKENTTFYVLRCVFYIKSIRKEGFTGSGREGIEGNTL